MDYEQIINEILLFAKRQFEKDNSGEYIVNIENLIRHFDKNYSHINHKEIFKMIDEIDARGWLLSRDSLLIVFDPATFN